ncbi:TIGR04222 domain-containing membrane protein [Micromonospora sp. NPDC000207]|uniref:TIGR04222 domain-containing membrane protein n=1 Tax=Micromonospora sp. NPDC000207 TaxID=3154246 RepID=UPI00332A7547
MTVLAAPGDTWGIPGPVFLGIYLSAVVVTIVCSVIHRHYLLDGHYGQLHQPLDAQQLAYLNGGEKLVVWTALTGLRASGTVDVTPDRRLRAVGDPPAGLTPVDRAVFHAAQRRRAPRLLGREVQVIDALEHLRTALQERGLILTQAQRHRLRLGAYLLMALALVGLVRLVAGLANDRPVGYLLLGIPVAVVAAVVLTRAPWQTRAAKATLRVQRQKHRHLSPGSTPSYTTYGSSSASMGVALYGTAALWAFDPAFAEQAEIQREGAASGATSSGGGGGDAGSGCGSGGGGGGGCGGGGGGCGG